MFISRVEIPWEAARNPYEIHRQVWRLFPGEERETRSNGEEARQGFLFRIEDQSTGRPARLLVQSRQAPVRDDGLQLLASREIQPAPTAGQRLAFVLTANPVKTITDTYRDTKPGKQSEKCRVPLIKEDAQRDWLVRKLGTIAMLESVNILPHPPLYFRKGKHIGKLVTCTFEGVIRVDNPKGLTRLLENGIGTAKAFGCGLFLVRRIE
ncbi:type I-E CRISPR-associated protein Cas6/Cse3/CasE [Pseudomethylobacillus aquaticus]|uniref:Type I-E CRISPR-associated protein Cas6/Cse3/CasE n=1 Tax=Pseudomethylobacillus aquaticus TaxID=2676064 RepID=A0A3N0UVI0_9PROT|nr:type I-E CRISPR-associated protein Cas6/Cse3/CasE [Pseudomethylobacillus aquaticus]ROH84512.1 type I-E CRISPR-associated protein Cas6/Cse3/CasE [Pseudomethylobacillus aquaticus]